jgi:hypothetical protein
MPETQEQENPADVVARIQRELRHRPSASRLDAILEVLDELEAEVRGSHGNG